MTEEKFIRGLSFILEIGGDLEVDIPKFWDTLAAHLVASVMDGHLSLNALMVASRTKEPVVKNRGKFLAAVLHGCKGESESRVGQVWADSGLDLATCLSETGSQVTIFVKHEENFDITFLCCVIYIPVIGLKSISKISYDILILNHNVNLKLLLFFRTLNHIFVITS